MLGCAWDSVEVAVKASLNQYENSLVDDFIEGYLGALECFPRLHVITGNETAARALFAGVPNVSVHANRFPPTIHPSGECQWAKVCGWRREIAAKQWHVMWLDNFTKAPHVLYFDIDAIPILPWRCHHFFDQRNRAYWWSRIWYNQGFSWINVTAHVIDHALANQDSATVLPRALLNMAAEERQRRSRVWEELRERDMITLYPLVIPRTILPLARKLVTAAYPKATCFDEAWIQSYFPSHGDLLGKAAAVFMPESVQMISCAHGTLHYLNHDPER